VPSAEELAESLGICLPPDAGPTPDDEQADTDADCDAADPSEVDTLPGPRVADDDSPEGQLLVTVLYYGPEPRST